MKKPALAVMIKMCRKKKFDLIGAKIALSKALNSVNKKRREERYYYCKRCKSYHLTSEGKNNEL